LDVSPHDHFDTVIIGSGMSGLAAGIRLAHFNRNVLILERHNVPGGLNSFYSFDGRKFDVGLHAVTNYVRPGVKGTPLGKLFRQLRIDRDEFDLSEQAGSKVAFPGVELRFTNDFEVFESEVARAFPQQIDNFQSFLKMIREYNELDLNQPAQSARKITAQYISDPVLEEMIYCPVMYYGSARENDMDFSQFVIMFKSLFFEGFARPYDGVRKIIRVLIKKYRTLGGLRKMKCGVKQIICRESRVKELILDNGVNITADHVLSSIGLVETLRLCDDKEKDTEETNVGRLSFVETINILNKQPRELGWEDTIIFFNDWDRFDYSEPDALVDPRSGVICMPNNYLYANEKELEEGVLRVTSLANFKRWTTLPEEEYQEQKKLWHNVLADKAMSFLSPLKGQSLEDLTVYVDMFTPRTIEKYTGHLGGAVYGAPNKSRNGLTHLDNLYLCGTDQGFLGIIGAMLSGISMANLHILKKEARR
jgi:phytoene dehydrogenase-like protein